MSSPSKMSSPRRRGSGQNIENLVPDKNIRGRHDSYRNHVGFTLIELMLVVILISIITALSVPRFKRTAADFQLKNAAFNLYKIIQFARERALTEGQEFRIDFDFDKRSYQLIRRHSERSEGEESNFMPVTGRFGKKIKLSEELSLTGKEDDLTCYPSGNCDSNTIRVRGADSSYEISLTGLGSVVRIRETENR